ncbi:hypothetical protein CsSME_00010744 [Camellia sinensis var. sinensis]
MFALCYPYWRLHHGAQHVSRHVTRPKLLPGVLVSASYRDSRGGSFLRSAQAFRPLVIQGLLAGYDTKPIGAGLGHDT